MIRRSVRVAAALTLLTVVGIPAPAVAELVPPPTALLEGPPPVGWPDAPAVAAPIYLLVEATTGQVLAARGADERVPVASTVKILTALTVTAHAEPEDEVVIGDEVVGLEGASVDLEPGERWTVEELLQAVLVRSGNDAAEALATAVAGDRDRFVELMVDTAEDVGLRVGPTGSIITSPTGLDDEQRLSARDLATLGRVLLDDAELRAIVAADEVTLPGIGTDENRNQLIGDYPGATGIKTGFTEAAGNSVVVSALRDGRELIAVVLGAGADPERFVDATALLDHGFGAFTTTKLAVEQELLIAGGSRTITVPPETVTAPVDAEVTLDLPLPVRAPESGQVEVPVRLDGAPVASATASVGGTEPVAVDGGAALGRALVDGLYAALRADVGAGADADATR